MKHEVVINNMIKLPSNCAAQINYFVIYFTLLPNEFQAAYSSHLLECCYFFLFSFALFLLNKCWMLLFSFQLIKICNLFSSSLGASSMCGKWINFQRKQIGKYLCQSVITTCFHEIIKIILHLWQFCLTFHMYTVPSYMKHSESLQQCIHTVSNSKA